MRRASSWAAATASCDLIVSLLKSISVFPVVGLRRAPGRGGNEEEPDPAADEPRGADPVPEEQIDEELRKDAGLREPDSAGGDAAARRLQARPLAALLGRLRLGRVTRSLLEEVVVVRHQPPTFRSSSSSARSCLFMRFGTWMRTRASTSPLPPPGSFGAPRPLIRSSLPSSEPAGIFSDTAPSGVGTSTEPPSAAVVNETGTWTTRSSPRRSYTGDASTRLATVRSPYGPPV